MAEIEGLNSYQVMALTALYSSGLRGANLRRHQAPGEFTNFHKEALDFLMTEAQPRLDSTQALAEIEGLNADQVMALNIERRAQAHKQDIDRKQHKIECFSFFHCVLRHSAALKTQTLIDFAENPSMSCGLLNNYPEIRALIFNCNKP